MDTVNSLVSNLPSLPATATTEKEKESKKAVTTSRTLRKETLKLTAGRMRATVIDDNGDASIPLIDFELCNMATDLNDWSSTLNGKVHTDLKSNYFNTQIQRWEPLIEP